MIEIRPLQRDDNLEEIAKLIYITDPYIYPDWFSSLDEAIEILPYIMKRKTLYSYKNMIVALFNHQIAGFICYMDEYPKDNYNEMLKAYKDAKKEPNAGFYRVNEGYFKEMDFAFNGRYILCCAVFETYRRQHIASKLLQFFDGMTLQLAVVKANEAAKRAYEKQGFTSLYEYLGYLQVPCIEMIKEK